MDFLKAQTEFKIRRYLWSKMKAAEEIKELFPHFWLFKGGTTWSRYQFMKKMKKGDLEIYVSGLLKKGHRDAVRALGETITPEEQELDDQFRTQNLLPCDLEKEIIAQNKWVRK